jgi:hypothetical protein
VKKILVDAGNFYTKVYVMHQPSENGRGERADQPYQFYGRGFFPTLVGRAGDIDKGRMYYEHEGDLYAAGYDCSSSLRLEQIIDAFDGKEMGVRNASITLKKIIFDYADINDDLQIHVVVDSYQKAQVFEEIAKELQNRKIEITAFRGYDKRRINKQITIRLDLLSSGDAVEGFLDKSEMDFDTALVMDVGYRKTKIYMIDRENGVELFQVGDFGVASYYEKIVKLFAEEKIEDNHFLWLVKQVELGCEEVEVRREEKWKTTDNASGLTNRSHRYYDISLVMENVRWDLNKEFKRLTTDILTSYYTNRVEWTDMLMVTGGGASLSGDILRLSLEEDGYYFNELYVEKQPIYTVLEGACYSLQAPHTE